MASYESTVEVGADPEAAFDYLCDLSNLPEWDPSVRSAKPSGETATGVGARFDVEIGFYGRGIQTTHEIVEAERPSRLVVAVDGKITGRLEFRIAPSGEGSTIDYRATATMKGLAKLLDKGLKLAFEGIGENASAGMRKQLA